MIFGGYLNEEGLTNKLLCFRSFGIKIAINEVDSHGIPPIPRRGHGMCYLPKCIAVLP